ALGLCTMLGGLVLIALIIVDRITIRVLPPLLIQMTLGGLVAIGTFWLSRKGRYKLASQVFFYGFVFSISLGVYTFGGVSGPLFAAYVIPIMAAGLLGKAGDGARLFAVALACYTALALIQIFVQPEPAVPLTGVSEYIFFVAIFGTVGALLAY